MRIAVNTRFLLHNKLEGIGRFSYETLSRITRAHPEHEFIFFFDRTHHPEFIFNSNVKAVELFPPTRHPLLIVSWLEFSVFSALKKYNAEVFISMDGFLSLRSKVPQIAVVHDLAYLHFAQGINFSERLFYTNFMPLYLNKASRIIAVSKYTKQDVMTQYQISESKIDIVYNAPSNGFQPVSENIKHATRQKYSSGCEYFLYVGAMHPRKNVETLLKAFDQFKKTKSTNFKLVIAGRKAWLTSEIENTFENMQFKNDVFFTGWMTEDGLYKLTASSKSLVYIPFFEGFGLPIIESIACEVPVICSNVSSMPEVAGDAGLLVDPNSVEQTSNAILEMATNEKKYLELTSASKARNSFFNWDNSANELWNTILKTVEK